MTRVQVQCPNNDQFVSQHLGGLRTATEIRAAVKQGASEITVDFSRSTWVEAPLIVPIACLINELQDDGWNVSITHPNEPTTKHYLNTICFPGGITNTQSRTGTSLPLFKLDPDSETDALEEVNDKIRELIGRTHAESKSAVLNAVSVPLGEMLDNIDQHSEFSHAALMAQFYPTKEYVDICLADNGISIPGSYERCDIHFTTDAEAVRMAVERGISTKEDVAGVKQRGKGLRTIHNIVCNGLFGELLISARNCVMHITRNNSRIVPNSRWDGTVVAARILPPGPDFEITDFVV